MLREHSLNLAGESNIFQKGRIKHVEAENEAYFTFWLFRTVDWRVQIWRFPSLRATSCRVPEHGYVHGGTKVKGKIIWIECPKHKYYTSSSCAGGGIFGGQLSGHCLVKTRPKLPTKGKRGEVDWPSAIRASPAQHVNNRSSFRRNFPPAQKIVAYAHLSLHGWPGPWAVLFAASESNIFEKGGIKTCWSWNWCVFHILIV